jgi:hypothetical protein
MNDLAQLAIGTAVGLVALATVLWSHRSRTTTAHGAAVIACLAARRARRLARAEARR